MVPNAKNNLEYALFKTRVSLKEELNPLLEANIEHRKITNLNFQIALLMSSEATEGELLQQQLSCSKVAVHEKVLNSIKHPTIKFTSNSKQSQTQTSTVWDHASLKITIDLETLDGLFKCNLGIQKNGLYQKFNVVAQMKAIEITFWKMSGTPNAF